MPITNLPGALASPRPAVPFSPRVPGCSQSLWVSCCDSPAEELGWEVAGCPCRQCRHCPWLCTSCCWQQLTDLALRSFPACIAGSANICFCVDGAA